MEGEAPAPSDTTPLLQKMRYLQDFFDTSPVGYLVLNKSGHVLTCNQFLADLLNASKCRLIGASLYPFLTRGKRVELYLHLRAVFQRREKAACELFLRKKEGDPRRVRLDSVFIMGPTGRHECRSVVTDITEFKRAEANLQQTLMENTRQLVQMNALVKQMSEGLLLLDADGNLMDVNRAVLDLWGYDTAGPVLGPYRELVRYFKICDLDGRTLPIQKWPLGRVLSGEVIKEYEVRVNCHETGRSFVGSFNGTPIYDEEGRRVLHIVTVRDITEQHEARIHIRQSREALRRMNERLEERVAERTAEVEQLACRLRALAAEMSRVEQRERKRIARILHDHLQQILASARMHLERARTESDLERLRSTLDRVQGLVGQGIEVSRSLSVELSPPVLTHAGLPEGLCWLAGGMAEQHRFRVTVRSIRPVEPIPEEIRFFLFESVRELLFNAVKHAQVDEAEVTLNREPADQVRITVEDRGRGFDAAALEDHLSQEATFGLFSIRERMAHLGGAMKIDTQPGRGCRITLTTPVEKPPAGTGPDALLPVPADECAGARALSNTIRILVVEDHRNLRRELIEVLASVTDFEVVGEAADGREAVDLAGALVPDIVLMDVNLPEINGIEATRMICERHPNTAVIGLSMDNDGIVAMAMKQAGAAVLLSKEIPSESLAETIRKTVR